MKLDKLTKITAKSKKRVGRGRGSGRGGHTVGRGQKGQKSRSRVPLVFEGTKIKKSLLKRLPLLRGKGKLKPQRAKPVVVNLKYLNLLSKGDTVDIETLVQHGIVGREAKVSGVKILGEGEINISLNVKVPVSGGARKKIEKAGGKVETTNIPKRVKRQSHE